MSRAGVVPLELPLGAGTHTVIVHREGFDDAEANVALGAGDRRDVTVDPTRSRPLTSRWWFWTGLGVVVVGGASVAAAALIERPAGTDDYPPGQLSAPLVAF